MLLTMVCAVAADNPPWVMVTVAVPELTETETVMPLFSVMKLLPLVRVTSVPSINSFSATPLARSLTRMVIWTMACPDSTVSMLAPLNKATAEPSSVKVGLVLVTLTTGASLTACRLTVTVAAALAVPVSSVTTTLSMRAPVASVVVLLLL